MARTINPSKVAVLAVGHALVAGDRGTAGGAPSKDSIWGIAHIGRDLVTFSGRRGGKLRFKAEARGSESTLAEVFKAKKAGAGMNYHYTDITKRVEKVVPDLASRIASDYTADVAAGKVTGRRLPLGSAEDIRKHTKAARAAA